MGLLRGLVYVLRIFGELGNAALAEERAAGKQASHSVLLCFEPKYFDPGRLSYSRISHIFDREWVLSQLSPGEARIRHSENK